MLLGAAFYFGRKANGTENRISAHSVKVFGRGGADASIRPRACARSRSAEDEIHGDAEAAAHRSMTALISRNELFWREERPSLNEFRWLISLLKGVAKMGADSTLQINRRRKPGKTVSCGVVSIG